MDFLTCFVFAAFVNDSEHFRKIVGECLLPSFIEESVLTPEDFVLSIYYAVLRSSIAFLLCYSCYQYPLTKHCEVKILKECGGKL